MDDLERREESEDLEPGLAPTGNRQAWLVTFTDLVSLMLTFFVMLFSMSSVQVDDWQRMIDALTRSLNPVRDTSAASPTAQYNISSVFRRRAVNLDYLTAVLEDKMAQDEVLARSRLELFDDRLVISLPGDLLFGGGSAVLSEQARAALFDLGGVLRNVDNQLVVNGHSDPVPYTGADYASNWELSLARAVAVSNTLRRSGYTQEVLAFGHADASFARLPADLPAERRRELARRVDIEILPTGGRS